MSTSSERTQRFPFFRRMWRGLFSRKFLYVVIALVTLVALFYAEENFRGKRTWEKCRAEIEARGQPVDMHDVVPQRFPDEENFAATPFIKLLFGTREQRVSNDRIVTNRWPDLRSRADSRVKIMGPRSERRLYDLVAQQQAFAAIRAGSKESFETRDRSQTERAEAARQLLNQLAIYEPVLDEFRANMSRRKAQYPIDYLIDEPYMIVLPHLAKIKSIAQEISFRISAELAVGETNGAFNDVLLSLRLADSLHDEPLLISQLVRLACIHITAHGIWEGLVLHRWSDAHLAEIQARMGNFDFMADMNRSMQFERAASISTIDAIRRRGNLARTMEMFDSPEDKAVPSMWHNFGLNVVSWLAPRGWLYLEQVNYCRYFDEYRSPLSKPEFVADPAAWERRESDIAFEMSGVNDVHLLLQKRFFARKLLPALGRVNIRAMTGQTVANQVLVACALERYRLAHGQFPESLAVLMPQYVKVVPIDFFSREPLKYRRLNADRFILYSVGRNGQDDGGMPGKTMFDEKIGDWVWRIPPQD